jgi:urease accessory protein
MSTTALLLLADGRLPAGGHAHSGGVEAAVRAGRVHDLATLHSFLRGRLATAGLMSAAFAAAAAHQARIGVRKDALLTPGAQQGVLPDQGPDQGVAVAGVVALDAALDARTPSPALRKASRAQGRSLLRAGRAMWAVRSTVENPHHAVALGLVAAAAGLSPTDAALAAAHGAVTGPAAAAVRLLALDPYPVQGLLAGLAAECDRTAAHAASFAERDPDDLPARSAPLLDISAEAHATWEVRLFAS